MKKKNFVKSKSEYKKIEGKVFYCKELELGIKILNCPDEGVDKDVDPSTFIYEQYLISKSGNWKLDKAQARYSFLQDTKDPNYKKYRLTPFCEINSSKINDPFNILVLCKNGNLCRPSIGYEYIPIEKEL